MEKHTLTTTFEKGLRSLLFSNAVAYYCSKKSSDFFQNNGINVFHSDDFILDFDGEWSQRATSCLNIIETVIGGYCLEKMNENVEILNEFGFWSSKGFGFSISDTQQRQSQNLFLEIIPFAFYLHDETNIESKLKEVKKICKTLKKEASRADFISCFLIIEYTNLLCRSKNAVKAYLEIQQYEFLIRTFFPDFESRSLDLFFSANLHHTHEKEFTVSKDVFSILNYIIWNTINSHSLLMSVKNGLSKYKNRETICSLSGLFFSLSKEGRVIPEFLNKKLQRKEDISNLAARSHWHSSYRITEYR